MRRRVATNISVAALLGGALFHVLSGGAEASSVVAPHGVVVVGDSITANYNDKPGHRQQGWWSLVARHLGADVTTYAQAGSGYVRSGDRCRGNRFSDRSAVFERRTPALFLIEGGRNDWAYCFHGNLIRTPDVMIASSVERYLDALESNMVEGSRIVLIGPPWGPKQQDEAERVTRVIAAAAARRDITFVDTSGTINRADRVVDGVHPNRSGSEAIAAAVIEALEP